MKKIIISIFVVFVASSASAQSNRLAGEWGGNISTPTVKLHIKTNFTKADTGYTGSIELQGVTLPLYKISVTDEDSVFFEFHTAVNVAMFKGVFKSDSIIAGQYHQAGYSFPFKLGLGGLKPDSTSKEADLPYNHKDLIINNNSVKIGGTLTWPEDETARKLVITITGSSPQNRDEEIFGFKIFGIIADYLTRHGIAVFRYDDRGVGTSTGSLGNATLSMLASDVEAIMKYFSQQHDSIPAFSNIILLGHSQGGIVAGKVAAENKAIDKIILMSSPGLQLSKLLIFQTRYILNSKLTDNQLKAEIATRIKILEALQTGKGIKKAKKQYQKELLQQLLERVHAIRDSVNTEQIKLLVRKRTNILVHQYQALQNRSLLFYNPVVDLQQLHIPVLVLLGGKDIQVPVELNKEPIKQALEKAGVPYKIKIFENANHLYQKAKTGAVSEYATLEDEFVEGFLETIAKWVKK